MSWSATSTTEDAMDGSAKVVGPWGDWCRCKDCMSGSNGPVQIVKPVKG